MAVSLYHATVTSCQFDETIDLRARKALLFSIGPPHPKLVDLRYLAEAYMHTRINAASKPRPGFVHCVQVRPPAMTRSSES